MSIARRHKQRVLAEKEAAASAKTGTPETTGSTHDLMLANLRSQEVILKDIQSIKAKIDKKAEFLPDYADYVDGVLASDAGQQDMVLMTVMVWRLDTGDLQGALEIGDYALSHGLKMPERFSRNAATCLLEETAEAALALDNPSTNQVKEFTGYLDTVIELTKDHDMADEARAKAYKARGLLLQGSDPDAALTYLKVALEFDDKCGVKTLVRKLEKTVRKMHEEIAGSSGE